jgi:hypothetical protein
VFGLRFETQICTSLSNDIARELDSVLETTLGPFICFQVSALVLSHYLQMHQRFPSLQRVYSDVLSIKTRFMGFQYFYGLRNPFCLHPNALYFYDSHRQVETCLIKISYIKKINKKVKVYREAAGALNGIKLNLWL